MSKIQAALQELLNKNIHFARIGSKIRVYASSSDSGSHNDHLDKVKAYLERQGFAEYNRDFDLVADKGYSDFRLPGVGE